MDTIIKNGLIITADGRFHGSIGIKDGAIAAIYEVGEEPSAAEVIDAKARHAEVKVRGIIALAVLAFIAIAISVAAIIGLRDGTFNELNGAWIVAASPFGAVVTHYLGRKNE